VHDVGPSGQALVERGVSLASHHVFLLDVHGPDGVLASRIELPHRPNTLVRNGARFRMDPSAPGRIVEMYFDESFLYLVEWRSP
jgi:hypothetical protein